MNRAIAYRAVKNTVIGGVGVAGLLSLVLGMIYDWSYGIPVSGVSGLLFGAAIALYIESLGRSRIATFPFAPNESLLHDGPANYVNDGHEVGGWLFLTNQRLVFQPHTPMDSAQSLEMALAAIVNVAPMKSFAVIPNGLRIMQRVNETPQALKFIVDSQRVWLQQFHQNLQLS